MQYKALLDSYFVASNNHDVAATLDHFAVDSIVHDEGKTHRGHDEIRHWLEETNANYKASSTVLDVSTSGNEAKALVSVSGTFQGSPIELEFNFTFAGDKIQTLNFGE